MDRGDLGQLGRALWGAAIAWMLALMGLSLYLPFHQADPSLPPEIIPAYAGLFLDNRPTKYFFAAFFLLGSGCAYLVSRSRLARRLNAPAVWVGIVLFVPAVSHYTAHVFARQVRGWESLVPWACVLMPVVITAVLTGLRNLRLLQAFGKNVWGKFPTCLKAGKLEICPTFLPAAMNSHKRDREVLPSLAPRLSGIRGRWPGIAMDLLAAMLIVIMLVPSSIGAAAARVGLNCHPVAYFIGPALYHYGNRLTPGIDYYSLYGIAPGYLFSFLMREQAQATIENYIWLCVALCGFFFISLYLVLRRPVGRMWSLAIALFILILLFATNAAFLCPSSWVLRFPLLPAFGGLLAHAVRRPADWRAMVWLGVCTGLSIFWNTETGLCMLCAGGLILLVHDWPRARRGLGPLAFAGITLLTVVAACSLAYQERVWSASFVRGMFRPLFVYGGGFGGMPLEWDQGWNRIYAVAFPLLVTATVGWGLAELGSGGRSRCSKVIFPLLFALLGLCFLVKWVNRSYEVVWIQNAVPSVVAAGWWLRRVCRSVERPDGSVNGGFRRGLAAGLAGVCAILAGAYLYYVKDPRFDQPLAARAFWEHPSVAKALLTRDHSDGWPAGLGCVSAKDVSLIHRLTRPDEPIALISPDDWVYLLAARRAPKLEIMPGAHLFRYREIIRSFAGIDRLFVEIDSEGAPRLPPNWPATFPVWTYASLLLAQGFDLEAVGDRLAVYRRRAPVTAFAQP